MSDQDAAGRLTVRPSVQDDLRTTADLHITLLPHGLFPLLGQRYMRRWHGTHLASDTGVLLVAESGGQVAGFLLGTLDHHEHVAWTLRHARFPLLRSGVLALLRRPRLLASFVRRRGARYLRRLLRRRTNEATPTARGGGPRTVGVLEAIAVTPQARSTGVGAALVDAFLAELAARDVRRVELVTKADNDGAGRFYTSLGWRVVESHHDRDGDVVLTFRTDPVAQQRGTPQPDDADTTSGGTSQTDHTHHTDEPGTR